MYTSATPSEFKPVCPDRPGYGFETAQSDGWNQTMIKATHLCGDVRRSVIATGTGW
jgi:hypothetical protein